MESYDLLMLIVVAATTIFGAIKGFAWQLASIASITVSYVVAYRFREPFSQMIKAEPPWNKLFAMLLLYIGTSLVIWMLFRMLSRTLDRLKLKEFDRQVGAMVGLAKGILYCSLITLFSVTLLGANVTQKIVTSRSGLYISRMLNSSKAVMPPEVSQVIQPYLSRLDQQLQQPPGSAEPGAGFNWPIDFSGTAQPNAPGGGLLPDSIWQQPGSGANNGMVPGGFDPRTMVPPNLFPQAQQPPAGSPTFAPYR